MTYNEVAEGGITIGGVSPRFVLYFTTSIDGAQGGGTSTITNVWFRVSIGGIENRGNAYYYTFLPTEINGGVRVDGLLQHDVSRSVIAVGGGLLSGIAFRTDPVNRYPNLPNYSPLVVVGGEAGLRFTARYDTEDGVATSGLAIIRQSILNYEVSGGVTLTSDNGLQFTLLIDVNLLWRARGRITIDRTILWDTGRLRQYFYRVVGREREDECDQLKCCMIFVVNINASTIANLCEKLRERQFRWPVQSVHRFSRPAESIAIAEDTELGIDNLCNELEEVDICSVPICGEFCITADAVINIGLTTLPPQVNAFFVAEAESGLAEGGSSILISGETSTTVTIAVFSLYFTSGDNTPSEHTIVVGGDSSIEATDHQVAGSGNIVLAGQSDASTENWNYIGGDWPYEASRYPLAAETLTALPIGVEPVSSWLQVPDVLTSNNLSTFVDVSWNGSSNYLYVKSFDFNIPEDSRVGLIKIYIERKATFNVRDQEVYLVRGNEIISPNLANPAFFPLFDTITAYSVIDNSFTQTIPGVPQQIGGWTVDDINDPEFGVIIRVIGQVDISGVIASIDAVGMTAYYEDNVDQILRPSGEAGITASSWTAVASGNVTLNSNTIITTNFTSLVSGGVKSSGGYRLNLYYQISDEGLSVAGESTTTSNHIEGLGGSIVGGEVFISTPKNIYYPDGDVVELSFGEGGAATRVTYKKISADGGVFIEGDATAIPVQGGVATGGISLDGSSLVVTSVWAWGSDGNAIFAGGAAEFRVSNFDNILVDLGFSMDVTAVQLLFGSDVETSTLKTSSDTITVCGCVDIPLVLNLSHNLVNRNKFSHFLARNNLFMPRKIKLYYNAINDMWQSNYSFKGISADFGTLESWNLFFDIRCTQIVGGVDVEQEILALSMQIIQKNISTLEDFSTRMIIGFLPDIACANGILQTNITYNTKLDMATVKAQAQIYYHRLFDDLDLFKNEYWTRNPELKIQFSSVNLDQLQYRQNMDIIFAN